MGAAVEVPGHQKPVPMYCRIDVERILDGHLRLVAAAQAEGRTKNRA